MLVLQPRSGLDLLANLSNPLAIDLSSMLQAVQCILQFPNELVRELQNALDSLKHGTQVDRQRIAEIRKQIKTAPWLKHKREDQVSRMPVSIEVEPTDKVGYLYNAVRNEIDDFFRTTLPIGDFHGVISGATFTQEMYAECKEINRLYAAEVSRVMSRKAEIDKQLTEAETEYEA